VKSRYTLLTTAAAILLPCSLLGAMSEREYRQQARRLRAITLSTTQEVQRVRADKPSAALELFGQVSGILRSERGMVVMIRLSDGASVEARADSLAGEIQPGVRVKALVRAPGAMGALALEAIMVDNSRHPPLSNKVAPSAVTAVSTFTAMPLPSRGGEDVFTRCKRAIAYFNSRLSPLEVEVIAGSIINYSRHLGIDPYFVVAVVAAESRFNPNARSYKGAMGLGQLMPGTARGIGVKNPWDPVENLAGAIWLLRGHLEKYQGQPYQVALALGAYNAGSGAVKKHQGVPPYRETRNYIWKVYEYYCWMHGIQPEPRYGR